MKPSVLIVDDEVGLAEMVCEVLSDRGCDVEIASNGEVALVAMAEKRPDLVLLDVMMPIMDGTECLARMRSDAALEAVPVIMMSAVESARPDGSIVFQGFLVKPFSFTQLLALIAPYIARPTS